MFPLLTDEELDDLAEDVKKNGLLNPITTYKDEVIDGRNRLLACLKGNIEPTFRTLQSGADLDAYVTSMNLKRRHLSVAKRIEIGLKIEESLKKSKIKNTSENKLLEHAENKRIAKKIGSNIKTVEQGRELIKKAESNSEVQKKWQKALNGETSVKKTYQTIVRIEKPKPLIEKPKNQEEIIEELQAKKIQFKSEADYWYQKTKQLIDVLIKHNLWDSEKRSVFPIAETETVPYLTMQELRKAELI